ncbi:MAG: metal-dependent hydrolase [Rubrivivax sp.]|nr:metal-dependent hydrolase [Pyrinomonadaceae bacterium]
MVGAAAVAAVRTDVKLRTLWKYMAVGAALAVVPDLDMFLTNVLHLSKSWHRSFSHSLAWALAVGLVAAFARRRGPDYRAGAAYGAATLTHAILDALVSVKGGVALLWPITQRRFTAGLYEYPDVLRINYNYNGDVLLLQGLRRAAAVSFWELLFGGAVLIIVLALRRFAGRLT